MCYFKFICIASSTGVNKKSVAYLVFLYYQWEPLPSIWVFCSTLLTFGICWSRTLEVFKMKLLVVQVNCWELLQLLQRVPSYVAGILNPPLKSTKKLRWRQHNVSPMFWFHWLYLISSHFDWLSFELSKLLYQLLSSLQSCCID